MRVRTTKRLTPEEIDLLLAIGARDEKDFVYGCRVGQEATLVPLTEWPPERIKEGARHQFRGFYLFEKIEEDEKL